MLFALRTNYDNMKFSGVFATRYLLSLILLYFGANLIDGNKDIPSCQKRLNDLGNDLADWRERCFDGIEENNATCCKKEKEYLEVRRRSHQQTCFYEGKSFVSTSVMHLKWNCFKLVNFRFTH